jgi:hypothetical protein
MKQFMSYGLPDGRSLVVEVDESEHEHGLSRASRRSDEVILRSQERFEEVTGVVRSAGEVIFDNLRSLAHPPDEIQVEFGLKLTFSAGAVIAATAGEGNFKISLAWRRNEPVEG